MGPHDDLFQESLPDIMYYGMNEHNLIQVECENNSTVNKNNRKKTISIILPRYDSLELS